MTRDLGKEGSSSASKFRIISVHGSFAGRGGTINRTLNVVEIKGPEKMVWGAIFRVRPAEPRQCGCSAIRYLFSDTQLRSVAQRLLSGVLMLEGCNQSVNSVLCNSQKSCAQR